MIEKYIKFYIDKLKIEDIKKFSLDNNIYINDNEIEIIYKYIKQNWYEICFKENEITFNKIKPLLKNETYEKAKSLIEEYKKRYKSYL